jgi:leucyl/phenylalanyl-tRNA---protein transferase
VEKLSQNKDQNFETFFPNPLLVSDELIAVGGDFSAERLYYAYTHGIFPWSENPIRWYSPDPRAIFSIPDFHISKTIKKKIKKKLFRITFNQAFKEVMLGCSFRFLESTWITKGFITGYTDFFQKGFCHSVEAWNEKGELVGGVYGVAIGKLFAGESMFARESDAGKIALTYLFNALEKDGFSLFDTQALNETTWNLGAFEIPRTDYIKRLKQAVRVPYKWVPPSIEDVETFLEEKFKHSPERK